MKKINDFENVKASGEGQRIVAGGYVTQIITVEDFPNKEYLKIEFDIAEGDYAGYYEDGYHQFGFWGGTMYRSYKDTAQGMFKGFINAIEDSNEGYKWNWDEKSLIGALVGVILQEEEYVGNDGSVKTRLKVSSIKSADNIRNGKFKVPEKKLLPQTVEAQNKAAFEELTEDIPFA